MYYNFKRIDLSFRALFYLLNGPKFPFQTADCNFQPSLSPPQNVNSQLHKTFEIFKFIPRIYTIYTPSAFSAFPRFLLLSLRSQESSSRIIITSLCGVEFLKVDSAANLPGMMLWGKRELENLSQKNARGWFLLSRKK